MLLSIYLYIWILAYYFCIALFSSFLCAKRNKLVDNVTVLLLFSTAWIFSNLALRLGVAPGFMAWFRVAETCMIVIPLLVYRVIRIFAGLETKVKHVILLWIIMIILLIFAFLGAYFEPTFPLSHTGITSTMMIDDIYSIVLNPKPSLHILGIYLTVMVILSVRVILKDENAEYRPLYVSSIVAYWFLSFFAARAGSEFPFELIGRLLCGYMFIKIMRHRKILDFKGFVNHVVFAILSVLSVVVFCVLLHYRDWGKYGIIMEHVLLGMMAAALATGLMMLFYEFLYSKYFVDRGKYLLRCSSEYHDELFPLMGDISAIAFLFKSTLKRAYGKLDIVLYVYDDKKNVYKLVGYGMNDDEVFQKDHPIVEHAMELKGAQSSWNIFSMLGLGHDELGKEIEEKKLTLFAPLKVNENVVGFYFLGGDRVQSFDKRDKDALSSLSKTTAMAVESSMMMHSLANDAVTDQLTGVYDRHTTRQNLAALKKNGKPYVFLLFNIDDLKLYNLVYGIGEGDEILRLFASLLASLADDDITIGRVSGKTFSAFVEGSREKAIAYDTAVRRAFIKANAGTKRSSIAFSTGLLEVKANDERTLDELLNAVKVAEVQAKRNGKNRLCEYKDYMASDPKTYDSGFRIGTVDAISKALDLRDHFTYDHSDNVAEYARALAEAAGVNPMECQIIYEAGLVHDIGKISIPDSVLMNAGKLTPEEYEMMKKHVERGRDVIESLPHGCMMLPVAMTHHERWDGKGYPKGLKGEAIPLGGRCLAIADTFDAMTSKRVYKKAFSVDEALEEIERVSGSQLDPKLGPLFVKLVRDGKIIPHPSC